ncbi:MAG: hypothetical protein ACRD4T_00120 [Candidatus Acidiferrales bacterium]
MQDDKRTKFVRACLLRWNEPVLWGGLDCSELVALAELDVRLPDRRGTFRAQDYATYNHEDVEVPSSGDLGFYGASWRQVVHVIVAIDSHHCISADGATKKVTTLDGALARGARVRLHTGHRWYGGASWLGWRRHFELDE